MPNITFLPSRKSVQVPEGTTIFRAAELAGLPIASSCSEEAVCGKCNVQVVAGEQGLSPRSEVEVRLLKKERKDPRDRISCQVKILGDCTVTTLYW